MILIEPDEGHPGAVRRQTGVRICLSLRWQRFLVPIPVDPHKRSSGRFGGSASQVYQDSVSGHREGGRAMGHPNDLVDHGSGVANDLELVRIESDGPQGSGRCVDQVSRVDVLGITPAEQWVPRVGLQVDHRHLRVLDPPHFSRIHRKEDSAASWQH